MAKEKGKSFGARSTASNVNYTHYSLTEQLFEHEYFDFSKSVLEPACGSCHIAYPLAMRFDDIDLYDIDNQEFHGDFYKETRNFSYIISNPPYGKEADKFVVKAKEVATDKIAMLLRTNYLSGTTRFNEGIFNNLKTVHIFTRMPDLTAEIRDDGKYPTAMIVYAWLVWDMKYTGKPEVNWIDNQEYVLTAEDKKKIVEAIGV